MGDECAPAVGAGQLGRSTWSASAGVVRQSRAFVGAVVAGPLLGASVVAASATPSAIPVLRPLDRGASAGSCERRWRERRCLRLCLFEDVIELFISDAIGLGVAIRLGRHLRMGKTPWERVSDPCEDSKLCPLRLFGAMDGRAASDIDLVADGGAAVSAVQWRYGSHDVQKLYADLPVTDRNPPECPRTPR